jgi:hypothetical protein
MGGFIPGIGGTCLAWEGRIYALRGNHDAATRAFQMAFKRGKSKDATLHYDLGCSFLQMRLPKLAEQEFRIALQLKPSATWWAHGLVRSLLDQELAHRVIPELISLARSLPAPQADHVPFPVFLSHLVAKSPEQMDALQAFLEECPASYDATLLLARAKSDASDAASAIQLFRAARKLRVSEQPDPSASPAKPRFLIIGQTKAGTTSLFKYLASHPRMAPPLFKETHFFSMHYELGWQWYQSLFPTLPPQTDWFTGEATPTYLMHSLTPRRVASDLPAVRLIVILRDPVARAYSDYAMHRRIEGQDLPFEELVERDMGIVSECPIEDDQGPSEAISPYLRRSIVLPSLKRWLSHFPPEQLLIIRSEHLASDLQRTMDRVCLFLDVPKFVLSNRMRYNEGRYPPIPEQLRDRLSAWFQPHQQALEAFLNQHPGFSAR